MKSHAERLAVKEAAEREQVTGRLAALLSRTPAKYASWNHQQVNRYKEAITKTRRLLNMPKAALRSLRDAESILQQFH